MREFAFELALCARLEERADRVLGRQLGAAVATPGARVMDVVGVEPGPGFDRRARITDGTIPPRAIEADVGVGRAVDWRAAMGTSSDWAREAVDEALAVGFFAAERREGREYVRQTARYPDDWFGRLVGIENKPDLDAPGDLARQLRFDVSLGLFDEVVLATASYVTGAHLNRLPDAVGVWRVDPDTGEREVVREPSPLPVGEPGVEPVGEHSLRTDVALVDADEKARKRRRIAERAYGKGWRPAPDAYPPCTHASATGDGRPYCGALDRVVDPGSDCGDDCPAFDPGEASTPPVDRLRDDRTPWVRDPEGTVRRQSGLDRFGRSEPD